MARYAIVSCCPLVFYGLYDVFQLYVLLVVSPQYYARFFLQAHSIHFLHNFDHGS